MSKSAEPLPLEHIVEVLLLYSDKHQAVVRVTTINGLCRIISLTPGESFSISAKLGDAVRVDKVDEARNEINRIAHRADPGSEK